MDEARLSNVHVARVYHVIALEWILDLNAAGVPAGSAHEVRKLRQQRSNSLINELACTVVAVQPLSG